MFYTIYKITNNINGKFYIGKHKTCNLDDTYFGSGKILNKAIAKYGKNNFTKEYLFIFDNEEDMNDKEYELVNENMVKRADTYNINVGGRGGWEYVNSNGLCPTWAKYNKSHNLPSIGNKAQVYKYYNDEEYRNFQLENLRRARRISKENNPRGTFYGKKHTEETLERMRKPKNIGENNPSHGTMWIYSVDLKKNKKINKCDKIPEGWVKGRKMKF